MKARNEYQTIFDKIKLSLSPDDRLFSHLKFSLQNNANSEPSICSSYMQKEAAAQNILAKVQAQLPTARLEKNSNGAACICIPDVDSLVAELAFGVCAIEYVKPIEKPRFFRDEPPKYTQFDDSVSGELSSSEESSSEYDCEQSSFTRQ